MNSFKAFFLILLLSHLGWGQSFTAKEPENNAAERSSQPKSSQFLNRKSKDIMTMENSRVLGQSEDSSSLALGAPPLHLGSWRWIQSFSRREVRLDGLDQMANQNLRLREFTYAPLFFSDWNEKWKLSVGLFMSSRNLGREFYLHSRSTFFSGFLNFLPMEMGNSDYKWFWGFYFPDKSVQTPVLLGAGVEYESPDGVWRWSLRIPQGSLSYSLTEDFEVGAFVKYASASFAVTRPSVLKEQGRYIENKSFSLGLQSHWKFSKGLSLGAKLGWNQRSQTSILDSQFDQVRSLNESPGTFLSLGLGLGI